MSLLSVKFQFVLISEGSLAKVRFFPENEEINVLLEVKNNRKKWSADSFELIVENPFSYKLQVFGVSGTKWKAELNIFKESDNEFINLIKWKGKTGDTRRNASERTKPIKYIIDSSQEDNDIIVRL